MKKQSSVQAELTDNPVDRDPNRRKQQLSISGESFDYKRKKRLTGEMGPVSNYKSFHHVKGDNIRRRRQELGFSIGRLAGMLGTSRRTLHDYEREFSKPSVEEVQKLAEILNTSFETKRDISSDTKKRKTPVWDRILKILKRIRGKVNNDGS